MFERGSFFDGFPSNYLVDNHTKVGHCWFERQQRSRERDTMLRHTYIAYLATELFTVTLHGCRAAAPATT